MRSVNFYFTIHWHFCKTEEIIWEQKKTKQTHLLYTETDLFTYSGQDDESGTTSLQWPHLPDFIQLAWAQTVKVETFYRSSDRCTEPSCLFLFCFFTVKLIWLNTQYKENQLTQQSAFSVLHLVFYGKTSADWHFPSSQLLFWLLAFPVLKVKIICCCGTISTKKKEETQAETRLVGAKLRKRINK